MGQPVQRDGHWWAQAPDGAWLRWNEATQSWERPAAAAPPPPPPPPAVTMAQASSPSLHLTQSASAPVSSSFQGFKASRGPNKVVVAAVAGVVAVSVLLFGGSRLLGDDSEVAAAAPAPTTDKHTKGPAKDAKAEFIAKADALCRDAMDELKRMLVPSTTAEMVAYLERGEQIGTRLLRDLRALRIPKADHKKVEKLWRLHDRVLQEFSLAVDAARSGDATGIQNAMQAALRVGERFDGLALQYGLVECSKSD